jgi:hypothetical protein
LPYTHCHWRAQRHTAASTIIIIDEEVQKIARVALRRAADEVVLVAQPPDAVAVNVGTSHAAIVAAVVV